MRTKTELERAYAFCLGMAKTHYENFPVASVLLPKKLRRPIAAIYAFSRKADDIADEGDAPPSERLQQLDYYSDCLQQIDTGNYRGNDTIFVALQDSVRQFSLPVQLLEDLLIAFRQDVLKTRYADFAEVLAYCRYSANPVGRLILHLQGHPTETQLKQSDAICSALQLINFYQDVIQDFTEQQRIYIPQDELSAAGIEEAELLNPQTQKLAPILRSLYHRTQLMMAGGVELGTSIPGRLGWEIRAMTLGGIYTLSKLQQQPDKTLLSRPRLTKPTLLKIFLNSIRSSSYRQSVSRFL